MSSQQQQQSKPTSAEGSSFRVRRATKRDLDVLVSFALEEAKEAEGAIKQNSTIRRGIQAALENPLLARYWVLTTAPLDAFSSSSTNRAAAATDDDDNTKDADIVVGMVSVNREWSDWHAGFYWWIQSLFLDPSHRGRGLMAVLMEAVRKEAHQDKSALELRLYVHADNNPRAVRAYRKTGWKDSPYKIMTLDL